MTLALDFTEARCRDAVAERSGGGCELGCGRAEEMSHRISRGRGGSWTPSNILHLCSASHAWMHSNVAAAYGGGWFVESGADPQRVPVFLRVPWSGWFWIEDAPADGGPHLLHPCARAGRPRLPLSRLFDR